MGKRDKEHRKRVQKRNNQIKGAQKAYEKLYQEMMKRHLQQLVEEHKQNTSGMTENGETTENEEGLG